MPWFYVDDHFHEHRKPRQAGLAAVGLWTLAGSWCADNLTDGFVPADVARRWPKNAAEHRATTTALTKVGLWVPGSVHGETGWHYHDWTDVQPTRDEVLEKRAKRVAAGRKGGIRSGRARSNGEANASASASPDASASASASAQAEPKQKRTPSRPLQTKPANAGFGTTSADAPAEPPAAPDGAQSLIAEWLDHCPDRPPGRVIGHVAREVAAMLAEGIPAADLRRGLAEWHRKGLNPASLASVVHEVRTAATRGSTTDQRIAAGLALVDHFAELEGQQAPTQLAIGGAW